MTVEIFVQCVLGVLEKIEKKSRFGLFFIQFWANFGYVSYIPILYWQTHTFKPFAHIGL